MFCVKGFSEKRKNRESPHPEPQSFVGSLLLSPSLDDEESSLAPRCAGWLVRLCHMDLRKPSFWWVAGSSSLVASLCPEEEEEPKGDL